MCAQRARARRARGRTAFFGQSPAAYGDPASDPRPTGSVSCSLLGVAGGPSFTEAQPRIFPFPQGERLLAAADFATDCRDRRPALRLPSGGQDLLFGMPSSSCHRRVLLLSQEDHAASRFLTLSLAYFSGFGSNRSGVMARRWFLPSPRPVDCGYVADLEVTDDAKQSMPILGRAMSNGLNARALQMLLVPGDKPGLEYLVTLW